MQDRPIGKTDMSAGIIGLDIEPLDNKPYAIAEEVMENPFGDLLYLANLW